MALEFRGGKATAAVPLVFFIVWAIAICLGGVPDENGLILGMVLGLITGMFLCRSQWSHYAQCVVEGMADCIATVTIVAWFWAGMFAEVLREGGLVNGLVWLGHVSNAEGSVFVGVTFLLAATFSTAVGTGYGTTVAFTTLMYPTGLVMGADPVWLFGAILSGAALGDNLAPVSDTTVVSATTQETDIPGVVRSRFRYAAVAAVPALACFMLFGGGSGSGEVQTTHSTLVDAASPHGLIFLIPFAFVIFLALRGYAILVTLTWGIVVAIALGLACGLLAPHQLISFDAEQDMVGGALVDGITGYLSMAILILLIVAGGRVMRAGGAMDALVNKLGSLARNSVARAEMVIWSVVFSLNVFITINTAAEITAAPFVSQLGRRFHLHPYRRANMLDAVTSALGYIFPWGGGVLIGYQTIRNLAPKYEFLTVVSPTDVWPFVLHGWFLALVMLVAAVTGFGRMFEAADGSPTREDPRDQ